MKLLRYGAPGREKPGLADKDGNIRDLSKVITQVDDAMLSPRNLARLARVKPETLPIVRGNPRLGVPYAGISKFVAIGLNYSDHAAEAGAAAHDGQRFRLHAGEPREIARRQHRVVDLGDDLREVADVAFPVREAGLFPSGGAVAK